MAEVESSAAPTTTPDTGAVAMGNVAIVFEANGYETDGPKLMGRQMAGNGFLRAAAAAAKKANRQLVSTSPTPQSARQFALMSRRLVPDLPIGWVPADQMQGMREIGTLYIPDPNLGEHARRRLRYGVSAYSLCGITHTLSSQGAMDTVAGLLSAPVMPWDALICTSRAIGQSVKAILDREIEMLRWRFGAGAQIMAPVLPVIPLGVHCDDFTFTGGDRETARKALGIAPDAVMVLFVGRLSFHAKAHPWQMFLGLQAAAEKAGRPVTLVQCGWFANDHIREAFVSGAQMGCPDVTSVMVDGQDGQQREHCWAAADIFISLSDNIQESFGLTPVEAMAAGLPVVVSEWDGYRDTVRDGEDGFLIPTWMPPAGTGEGLARRYEAGIDTYDLFCGHACLSVSVDGAVLADRLHRLICDPALRRDMGASGAKRARELFDWAVIYRRYEELWAALAAKRRSALTDSSLSRLISEAPTTAPARQDPFRVFANHPTSHLVPATRISLTRGATAGAYDHLSGHGLFRFSEVMLPGRDLVERLFSVLKTGDQTVASLATVTGAEPASVICALAVLAKMGLVRLHKP